MEERGRREGVKEKGSEGEREWRREMEEEMKERGVKERGA